jgi:hypothetical protein
MSPYFPQNNWVDPIFKKILDKIAEKAIPASPWKPVSGLALCIQNFSNDIGQELNNNFPNVSANQAMLNFQSCLQHLAGGMANPF